jgi:ribosomal protein L19
MQGVGVEMNFFLNSPVLGGLEVLRRAKVGWNLTYVLLFIQIQHF